MRVTLVHVHVKPEHVERFIAATRRNHEGSVREPGNLRFDVLQSEDDPARFVLVEIFRDAEAVVAHKTTPHYLAWRDEVAGWMAAPREGRRYRLLAPDPVPGS
jgi:autoinducer 2-degrading protein